MHAGLYYEPNSLKAKLSRDGIVLMKEYCDKNFIKWDECGKVVVATEENQLDRLENTYGELLSDILLSNHHTEKRLDRGSTRNYEKVDKARKIAINEFMRFFPDE